MRGKKHLTTFANYEVAIWGIYVLFTECSFNTCQLKQTLQTSPLPTFLLSGSLQNVCWWVSLPEISTNSHSVAFWVKRTDGHTVIMPYTCLYLTSFASKKRKTTASSRRTRIKVDQLPASFFNWFKNCKSWLKVSLWFWYLRVLSLTVALLCMLK